MQQRNGAHRRAVILRTRPLGNVERAVGVDPSLAQERLAVRRREICLRPAHIVDSPAATASRQGDSLKRRPSRFCSDRLKRTKSAKCGEKVAVQRIVFEQNAQRVDHDGGIAQPVEEIVRLRIIGAEHGRGYDRALSAAAQFARSLAGLLTMPTGETLRIMATALWRY